MLICQTRAGARYPRRFLTMKNPNCDNDKCVSANGQVRVLPVGGQSNMILCRKCFDYEILYRRDRNRKLSKDCQFALPSWDDLKVYQ